MEPPPPNDTLRIPLLAMAYSVPDIDKRALDLGPRPTGSVPYNRAYCENRGIPYHKAELLYANDCGALHLAKEIFNVHTATFKGQVNAFDSEDETLPRILTVLCCMSPLTRTTLAASETHKLFEPKLSSAFHLPAQHHVPATTQSKAKVEERPVVYVMSNVNKVGGPPTGDEVFEVLEMMKDYATSHRDKAWMAANDAAALKIDRHKGHSFRLGETGWTPTAAQEKVWKENNGIVVAHPRRYCTTARNQASINTFCEEMESRIVNLKSGVVDYDFSTPLPWSASSVGWSRIPDKRKEQHHSHKGTDSAVKNLFETCLDMKTPRKNFYMRFTSLVYILDDDHAAVAEHAISILEGSYVQWGGLNATNGGGGGMQTILKKSSSDGIWKTAAEGVIKQGVFPENLKSVKRRLAADKFLIKYWVPGSEFRDFDIADQRLREAKDDFEAAESAKLQTATALYQSLALEAEMKAAEIKRIALLHRLRQARQNLAAYKASKNGHI